MSGQISTLRSKKISQLEEYKLENNGFSNIDESISLILAQSVIDDDPTKSINKNYKISFKSLVDTFLVYIKSYIISMTIRSIDENYIKVEKQIDNDNEVAPGHIIKINEATFNETLKKSEIGIVTDKCFNDFIEYNNNIITNVTQTLQQDNENLSKRIDDNTSLINNSVEEIYSEINNKYSELSEDIYNTSKEISNQNKLIEQLDENLDNRYDELDNKIYETKIYATGDLINATEEKNKATKSINYVLTLNVAKDIDPDSEDGLITKKQALELINKGDYKWSSI